MVILSEQIIFLPAGVELLVSVNPDPGIAPELRKHLERSTQVKKPRRDYYLRLKLTDALTISFRLHETGSISRDLEACRCFIPALSKENIRSLNQAYQKISAVFEPSRKSVGGRVYDNIYYLETDGIWTPLDELRNALYEPYQVKFAKKAKEITEVGKEQKGMQLPIGNCILVRENSPQPSLFFPSDVSEILDGVKPFAAYQNLLLFGPLDDQTLWRFIQCLESNGRHYGEDFVHIHNTLPSWCRLVALPN